MLHKEVLQMAKLDNYNGSVQLMAGITQRGGDFALVEANAVQTQEDGTRLDSELIELREISQESLDKADSALQSLEDKVDKVDGKGLSTNDYTTEEKNKLAGIEAGAQVNVQADWRQTNTDMADYIKNKPSIGNTLSASIVGNSLVVEQAEAMYENGLSAYELAKNNGFEGTEEDWLASLRGDAYIQQTTGDSETDVMSQKAVTDELDTIKTSLSIVPTSNLLNPSNSESGYIDVTTLEKVASSNNMHTVTPISLEGNKGKIYFRTTLPNDEAHREHNLCVIQLDAEGNKVNYTVYKVSHIYNNGGFIAKDIVDGASSIHVWISGVLAGDSFADWCISFEDLGFFAEYAEVATVKKEALPADVVYEDDLTEITAEIAEMRESVEAIEDVTELVPTDNLLNPANSESGYIDVATLAPMASENHMRTTTQISVEGHNGYLYYNTILPNEEAYKERIMCVVQYGVDGNKIDNSTVSPITPYKRIGLSADTTNIHVWISGVNYGVSFADWCISLEELDTFVEYDTVAVVKKEALPPDVVYTDDLEAATAELRESVGAIEDVIDIVPTANVLDPSNSESGYIDVTTLEEVASSNHLRTKTPISLVGKSKFYLRTSLPNDEANNTWIVCLIQLDAEGNQITYGTIKVNHIYDAGGSLERLIVDGASQLILWISGVNYGVSFADWCISFEELDDFTPYGTVAKIKESALPEDASRDLPFAGKTIVNFGDSIFGNKRPPNDISTKLAELTGATVHNCGFGGCRMSTHTLPNYAPFSMFALADAIVSRDFSTQETAVVATDGELVPSYFANTLALLKSIDFAEVDIITIAYGTNDFTASKALDNEDNKIDTNTFAGAMRYSIEKLLETYPHLQIFSCGQTYRFWMDAEGVFVEDSDTKAYNGSTLHDFVAKTKEVAEEYHLPFIDNYNIGMNKFNRSVYFPATDGTHPNVTGNELIARHIAKELF
jgi:lysophospholipase L1-like esterase